MSGTRAGTRWRAGLAAACLLQVAATTLCLHPRLIGTSPAAGRLLFPATAAIWIAAIALLARSGLARRSTAAVVLIVGAALQVAALSAPPATSNDVLRYSWDAKVQLAGIDPYRYAPDAPQLDRLHEPALFTHHGCADSNGCALLNRPQVHTVYPPVAQAAFVVVRVISAGSGGQTAFQIAAALGVLVISSLLLRELRARNAAAWYAAVWAWCPIVVSEFGNNAHIDWLAIILVVLALGASARQRQGWAGALIGAAIIAKLYPVAVLPALARRQAGRVVIAAAAVGVIGYLPHVWAVGPQVIGYLPGYLHEEGYASGSRLELLGRIFPGPVDTIVGALVLVGLALLCWRTSDPLRPEIGATWLFGATVLVTTPNYPWYAALLVALVVMSGAWHWLPVAFAPTYAYVYGSRASNWGLADSLIFAAAGLATALWWWFRRRSARGSSPKGHPMVYDIPEPS